MNIFKRLYYKFLVNVVNKNKIQIFNYKNGSKSIRLPWSVDNPDADKIFPKFDPISGKTTYPEGWGK